MPSILVVDESSRICGLIAEDLQAKGCKVVAARDGAEALTLLETTHFDAVVIEVIMSDGDSFSAIAAIRQRWPHCLVVAMSAGGRFVSATEALDVARVLGAHVRLAKPVSLEVLRSALEPALMSLRSRSALG